MMRPGSRQLVVSLIVACAMFIQNLASTIIATALPAIGESLGENPLRLNVAITCYLLSLAVFIPISGWTADRFGARRVFTGAIIVFTLGSIACGFAQSLGMLVLPYRAGNGRRNDGAGRPPRAAAHGAQIRARARDVLCQRAGTDRPGHRPAARRLYRDLRVMALDFFYQYPDRHARRPAGQSVC